MVLVELFQEGWIHHTSLAPIMPQLRVCVAEQSRESRDGFMAYIEVPPETMMISMERSECGEGWLVAPVPVSTESKAQKLTCFLNQKGFSNRDSLIGYRKKKYVRHETFRRHFSCPECYRSGVALKSLIISSVAEWSNWPYTTRGKENAPGFITTLFKSRGGGKQPVADAGRKRADKRDFSAVSSISGLFVFDDQHKKPHIPSKWRYCQARESTSFYAPSVFDKSAFQLALRGPVFGSKSSTDDMNSENIDRVDDVFSWRPSPASDDTSIEFLVSSDTAYIPIDPALLEMKDKQSPQDLGSEGVQKRLKVRDDTLQRGNTDIAMR